MIIIPIFTTIFGLLIGSFLAATVWRIKLGKSVDSKRSICLHCKHVLAANDLIPLLSWVWLRGQCRYCKKPIGWFEPIMELATAILFGLSYLALHPVGIFGWVQFVSWLYLLGSLIILTAYDLRWLLLPNVVVFPAMVVAAVSLVLRFASSGDWHVVAGPLLAALLAGGMFAGLAMIAGGKLMGFGDVKLVLLMGLILGLRKLAVGLFIGFDTAALVGVILLITKIRKRSDHIPFGPFLALGTVVAYLYGTTIIHWYLHLLTVG